MEFLLEADPQFETTEGNDPIEVIAQMKHLKAFRCAGVNLKDYKIDPGLRTFGGGKYLLVGKPDLGAGP